MAGDEPLDGSVVGSLDLGKNVSKMPDASDPKKLVGTWGFLSADSTEVALSLRSDQTGEFFGDRVTWSANDRTLSVRYSDGETVPLHYALVSNNEAVALKIDCRRAVFVRLGTKK